jgi:hypothetical protein
METAIYIISGVLGILLVLSMLEAAWEAVFCQRGRDGTIKRDVPWWESMDRLYFEYEEDIHSDAAWDDPDHTIMDFDAWYRERYCTKKQPEEDIPEQGPYR